MPVTLDRVRAVGGVAGILFVVLAVVALFLPGTPPKADEVAKITSYFTDKRGDILASNYVLGAAFAFFLVFLGSLRIRLGAAGPERIRPGSVALAGGVAGTAMVLAGTAVANGAVFQVAAAGDANLNHALYDVANDFFAMSGFGFFAFFAGAALAIGGTGSLPAVMAPAGLVVALLNIVSGVTLFAKSGFFAIGGAFGFIVPLASLLWVLAASVVLLTRPSPARARASQAA